MSLVNCFKTRLLNSKKTATINVNITINGGNKNKVDVSIKK